jgi:transcriptional regulator GlxA family with amidase domain
MGAHVETTAYTPRESELVSFSQSYFSIAVMTSLDADAAVFQLQEFLRKCYDECSAFITICGGMLGPYQAGLFKGKTVTAPRFMLEHLRQQSPETTWVDERWHRDGKLWTSGALLNGLDLMRAFGTEYFGGHETLMEFVLNSGHYPIRDVRYADAPDSV